MRIMKKRKISVWAVVFTLALTLYTTYTLLDAFVIPQDVVKISSSVSNDASEVKAAFSEDDEDALEASGGLKIKEAESSTVSAKNAIASETVLTDTSYSADGVTITLTEKTIDDTQVYIADIYLDDPSLLLSGLAEDSFGRNVSEKTSEIAQRVGAVLAINGDYYGFRDSGYVLRNGYLYRSTGESGNEDLVIYEDGTFEIIDEGDVSAEELVEAGAEQIYSFGPGLVIDGEISVSEGEEVGQAMQSNPRTAIGMIEKGHYVFVVSDGRTSESKGLTLSQLAQVMSDLGCTQAYNLDGGGSTTMVWNGTVVNKPTTNGHSIKERSVSDVIYISGS